MLQPLLERGCAGWLGSPWLVSQADRLVFVLHIRLPQDLHSPCTRAASSQSSAGCASILELGPGR